MQSDNIIEHQINTNKYLIIREIGSGSFGIVFKAKSVTTGRKVAIKYIKFGTSSNSLISVCREIQVNIFLANRSDKSYSAKLLDIFLP